MRTPDGLGRGFGETEVSYVARFHQLVHRAHGLFDRSVGIDAVLIIEIDGVYAESQQRRVAGFSQVLGPAVDPLESAVFGSDVPELGRHDNFIAPVP